MNAGIRAEIEQFIREHDSTKGGRYAHGGVNYNSTWLFRRFELLLDRIDELQAERDALALYVARETLDKAGRKS